jgi:hypothetical protein
MQMQMQESRGEAQTVGHGVNGERLTMDDGRWTAALRERVRGRCAAASRAEGTSAARLGWAGACLKCQPNELYAVLRRPFGAKLGPAVCFEMSRRTRPGAACLPDASVPIGKASEVSTFNRQSVSCRHSREKHQGRAGRGEGRGAREVREVK